ncbi:thiamine-phosphate pyrophosphorylase ThiE [Clostridium sporogenes]|uniref:Putative thiamine-phosphate diphosphorylase n=1 Tax=Clostridium sporogenes TaxID=1509 RepID=A0A7U4JPG8_CLOSG|nr:thiamine phosphate synthase [Clostridium sporogenes]AVP60329.1 thiamine phosphate synthase [Clostridium botulinum]AKC62902.1 putative thiamine-phosphate diphosphorylase [Clostridium sporogenes]AKJ90142.1 thiamine-phosphate pyrophosphorylase [Clostridium sporogenes]KCZ68281.1 putative thiamine-phosphate diphosphorylase [Clostridium sporogenes]OOO64993.1 thiamine phosphate synthase [Clostridium sporogenes]
MYKLLAITNRHICNNEFLEQMQDICTLNEKNTVIESVSIVLREKDLSEKDYKKLAAKVLNICEKNNTECILHTYYKVAKELNCKKIHLPLHVLKSNPNIYKDFNEIGVSIHSVSEAIEAMNLGATYITAGHIFATDCKKDLPPRGLSFLSSVCSSVHIPVYAIGGISPANAEKAINAGAEGVCIMSGLMTCKSSKLFMAK